MDGTGRLPGCGGEVVDLEQSFYITEPRLLNPDEQKQFCQKVVNSLGGGGCEMRGAESNIG